MATLVTIMNIGDRAETIDGNIMAIGDTLVVDLEDPVIQQELTHDMDYVILPDSALGIPVGQPLVSVDVRDTPVHVGNGTTLGNVPVALENEIIKTGDGFNNVFLRATFNRVGVVDTDVLVINFLLDDVSISETTIDVTGQVELPVSVIHYVDGATALGLHTYGISISGDDVTSEIDLSPDDEEYSLEFALIS